MVAYPALCNEGNFGQYATDETMPEDGLEKIADFVKSRNRFHRKCTSVLQKRMIAFIFAHMYAFI